MRRLQITPAVTAKSQTQFYYPPTLQDDFTAFQYTDIPHVTYTFEVVRDWYEVGLEGYDPVLIRAEYFPINWKSKIGNSDANSNFKTDYSVIIYKGDILIREDGNVYIANWKVQNNPNNQTTQAVDYNQMLAVERFAPREVDKKTGLVLKPAGVETVCPDIPAILSIYAGRPDYATTTNSPGIHPDHLVTGQVQANEITMGMRIGDEFDWFKERYRLVDVSFAEVDHNTGRGLVNFVAKRVAGAFIDE